MVIVCTFTSHVHSLAFSFEQHLYELHRHVVLIIFHCTLVLYMLLCIIITLFIGGNKEILLLLLASDSTETRLKTTL